MMACWSRSENSILNIDLTSVTLLVDVSVHTCASVWKCEEKRSSIQLLEEGFSNRRQPYLNLQWWHLIHFHPYLLSQHKARWYSHLNNTACDWDVVSNTESDKTGQIKLLILYPAKMLTLQPVLSTLSWLTEQWLRTRYSRFFLDAALFLKLSFLSHMSSYLLIHCAVVYS